MTEDEKKLWLSVFPSWPDNLFEKFSQAILIDFYRYGIPDYSGMGTWWQNIVSLESARMQNLLQNDIRQPVTYSYNLFNGGAAKFQQKWSSGKIGLIGSYTEGPSIFYGGGTYAIAIYETAEAFFDSRLWQWPIWFRPVLQNVQGGFIVAFTIVNNIGFNAEPYSGVDTILALHENGVDNSGIDYAAMYDYVDFRNAYEKYGAQISAGIAAEQQKQVNDLAQYKSDLADKLQSEKNQLQNLQLTMTQAMQNESANASRDMANLIISAQNLKLSLLQAIR